jgi:hypothetical protein
MKVVIRVGQIEKCCIYLQKISKIMFKLKFIIVALTGGMSNTTKEAAESQNSSNNRLSNNKKGGNYV